MLERMEQDRAGCINQADHGKTSLTQTKTVDSKSICVRERRLKNALVPHDVAAWASGTEIKIGSASVENRHAGIWTTK